MSPDPTSWRSVFSIYRSIILCSYSASLVPPNLLHTDSNTKRANLLTTVIMTVPYTGFSHYNCQVSWTCVLLASYQIIIPSSKPCEIFRNTVSFDVEELLVLHPTPQAGGPPLGGFPRLLLIQYIRSYAPYLDTFPPSAVQGRAMLWGQRATYHWIF